MTQTENDVPARFLTPYEVAQVRAIAAWKSQQPSRLASLVDTLTAPVTWAVAHAVPKHMVAKIVRSMETIAAKSDVRADVAAAAGVGDVSELAGAPLETCDRLARLFTARAEKFAVMEGAAASLGGPFFHAPQQLIAALRSIARIGHCYGYALTEASDHEAVIDILEIALLHDPVVRTRIVESLHTAIETHAESLADERNVLNRAGRAFFAEGALDFVPVVGTAAGFIFDNQFMHSVDETARRIFQERWLRDRGLVKHIAPAPLPTRASSYGELGRALGQGAYCLGAIAGFAVSFPCRFIQHMFGSSRNPIGMGAKHGSTRAVGDARDFLAGLRESFEDTLEADALADAPV